MNQSKEIGEKQFSVFDSRADQNNPLMHIPLCRWQTVPNIKAVAGPASAGPLFGPSMFSAVSLFLVSAHFTFYSDFIQSAKFY